MKQNIITYILLCWFLSVYQKSFAQNYRLNYEHITTKQGLSNNFINHIIQDQEGFIWIATNDGLNHYDGYNFEVFKVNPNDADGLPSNTITFLCEGNQGNIWIGTDKGLAKLNPQTRNIENIAFFENQRIHTITMDHQGRFWIITDKHNIFLMTDEENIQKAKIEYSLEGKSQKYTEFYGIIEKKLNGKYFLLAHYMDLQDGKEYVYSFEERSQTWQLALQTTRKIEYIDDFGKLYFVKEENESIKNPIIQNEQEQLFKDYHFIHLPFQKTYTSQLGNIHWVKKDRNHFYICLRRQLFEINTEKGEVLMYLDIAPILQQLESGFKITQLFKDKTNNIWIVTEDGFFIFPQYAFQNLKTYDNQKSGQLSGASTRAIYQDKEGNIWISNYNSQYTLDILLKNGEHKTLNTEGISFKIIPDYDDNKLLWIASGGQVLKVNQQTQEVLKTYLKDYPIGYIRDILAVDKNKMYLAGDLGLGVFDSKTETLETYPAIQFTTCIFRDKNQKLWLGTRDKGLGLLDEKTMQVQYFAYDKKNLASISSNHIKCIDEDKKGRFWIATTLGLNLFDPKTKRFTRFTEKDGLPNNMVYAILEDEQGNLWLSTNKGISKFNPDTKEFVNYDDRYGLQNNEFNTNAYFKNEQTGEMFFGGVKGVNSFFPEKMKRNDIPPSIVLTTFKREGKKVDVDSPLNEVKKIKMDYDEAQTLTFEFVALNFFQSHQNQYKYRIEGLQEDWINLGTKHELTLTNLNAGTYTLHIKGSNNHGLWNEEELQITLIVNPPFWQTWWFISIVALFFLAFVYGIYRWRVYQIRNRERYLENQVKIRTEEVQSQAEALEELNQTKDRLFSIIAHDLRNPIAAFESITQQLEFYIEQNELEKVKALSQYIKNSSNGIHDLLNNLLSWALMQKNTISHQPETFRLIKLVQDVLTHYKVGLETYQIALKVQVEESLEIYVDENALHTILRNLISNAIKFTPQNGLVSIVAYDEKDCTIIEVKDTGQGMSKDKTKNLFKMSNIRKSKGVRGEKGTGLGLVLVGDFMEMHQGHIQVLSEEDKGTTIVLRFPKKVITE